MTDQVLDVLKLVLLALLYVFFARVLWAVWSEVRQPANARVDGVSPPAPTPAAGVAVPAGRREVKPAAGRGGTPARLVILEPKERRGTAFALGTRVDIGRETDNTVVIEGDAYISSHHAAISHHEGRIVVDDLDSRNGTYLNGVRLTQRQPLNTGDRVQVGYTVLEAQ
ncbi:FHA domain-containing protein [Ilumatobacter sp.]|uniref:FHA domain-containing protein n=1 Tax=Ilumatobacter sp. TaxID=1967498 RepID=UPI003AF5DEA5